MINNKPSCQCHCHHEVDLLGDSYFSCVKKGCMPKCEHCQPIRSDTEKDCVCHYHHGMEPLPCYEMQHNMKCRHCSDTKSKTGFSQCPRCKEYRYAKSFCDHCAYKEFDTVGDAWEKEFRKLLQNDYVSIEQILEVIRQQKAISYQEAEDKTAMAIVEFLDELEVKQPHDLKTDNWRNWKYIRNSIVDKYEILDKLRAQKKGEK